MYSLKLAVYMKYGLCSVKLSLISDISIIFQCPLSNSFNTFPSICSYKFSANYINKIRFSMPPSVMERPNTLQVHHVLFTIPVTISAIVSLLCSLLWQYHFKAGLVIWTWGSKNSCLPCCPPSCKTIHHQSTPMLSSFVEGRGICW